MAGGRLVQIHLLTLVVPNAGEPDIILVGEVGGRGNGRKGKEPVLEGQLLAPKLKARHGESLVKQERLQGAHDPHTDDALGLDDVQLPLLLFGQLLLLFSLPLSLAGGGQGLCSEYLLGRLERGLLPPVEVL